MYFLLKKGCFQWKWLSCSFKVPTFVPGNFLRKLYHTLGNLFVYAFTNSANTYLNYYNSWVIEWILIDKLLFSLFWGDLLFYDVNKRTNKQTFFIENNRNNSDTDFTILQYSYRKLWLKAEKRWDDFDSINYTQAD